MYIYYCYSLIYYLCVASNKICHEYRNEIKYVNFLKNLGIIDTHESTRGLRMRKLLTLLLLSVTLSCTAGVIKKDTKKEAKKETKKEAVSPYYGEGLCGKPAFKCITLKSATSWEKLFPDATERDIVKRLNRSDTYLFKGRVLAVPDNFKNLTLFDISPFPLHIQNPGEKIILVDQNRLAWGAYDPEGNLVKWGPISSGKDYCPDVKRECRTATGIFRVFNKKDAKCRSNIYPVGRGGSIMPYCMFFYRGYALHGSNEVYGRRDSHGCVRMFTEDAKWLNENFVEPIKDREDTGTKLVIQPITDENVPVEQLREDR